VGLLSQAMLGMMILRLLVPPGCCLCQLKSPAAEVLASLVGKALPPALPEPPEDENHHDGCPASFVSTGLGLRPAAVTVLPPGFLDLPTPTADLPTAPVELLAPLTQLAESPASQPLFVQHCALRC
jgi:hypothetical protein